MKQMKLYKNDFIQLKRDQNNLASVKGTELVFDPVQLLYYKCHKRSTIRGRSCIDSPEWIKNATINSINKKDNKCFKYTVTIVLNHEEIKEDPQRITEIKHFINKYNWEGIKFPSEKHDWKKI